MNELPEIYRRIEYLRNKGVKMKEIADHTNMAASVLSSLYSSVLPTYIGCIKKGNNEEEALDYALSQVNNVSKKRLLGNLKELKEQLYALEPAVATGQKENPFLDMLSEEMLRSVQDAYNYSGIYISYSLSSSTNALKVEPYLITTSENNGYVKVVHMSAYNTTHFGTGTVHNLPATAYVRFSAYAQRALPLSRLQPQPDSPKNTVHQTLGQHRHGRLPGTERHYHPQRRADGRTDTLL